MKLLVFLHGTIIMHPHAVGRTREERVRQVRDGEASVHNFAGYVPVGNAVAKLRAWSSQGAEIIYLSSHKKPEHVEQDREVLQAHQFPEGPVVFRQPGERYQDVPDPAEVSSPEF